MTLFDSYVFVDWSARNAPSPPDPSPDAVWVGELRLGDAVPRAGPRATYFRTRQEAITYIGGRLRKGVEAGLRTLIGFDFPYGYPCGFASAIGADSRTESWRHVWDTLTLGYTNGPANLNNRFRLAEAMNARCRSAGSGPFWCCPPALASRWLTVKRAGASFPFATDSGDTLADYRICDRRVVASGRRIHTAWQLLGTGSVGGQALAGIPYVNGLRHLPGLDSVSRIWPFETGFTEEPVPAEGPSVLHVEIWPTLAKGHVRPGDCPKDRAQVLAMIRWISELDARSQLSPLFAPAARLTRQEVRACVNEEGWILGVQ